MSINLKNLRKKPPVVEHVPEPVSVSIAAELLAAPPPPTAIQAPVQTAAPIVPPMLPPKPRRRGEWTWQKYLITALIIIVLPWGAYYIYRNIWTRSPFGPTPGQPAAASASTEPVPSAEMTEAEIVVKVGTLMRLPEGEMPTLAKVSDPSVLANEAFFRHAKLGDIVLMYKQAERAILYDPEQNRIVEVGPIVTASSTGEI